MTTYSPPQCPSWCTDHVRGPLPEDEFHRRVFDSPGDAVVSVSLGVTAQDLKPVLSWAGEEHVPGGQQARHMAAALVAAATFLDEIEAVQA